MRLTNYFLRNWLNGITSYVEFDAKVRDGTSFDEFYLQVSRNQVIGTLFEILAKQALSKHWNFVYAWHDIPEHVREAYPNMTPQDAGIDLLVSNDGKTFVAVQVKWRSANKLDNPQVTMDHFECEMVRCGFDSGIMFTNFDRAHNTRKTFDHLRISWLTDSNVASMLDYHDFDAIRDMVSVTNAPLSTMIDDNIIDLRYYQKEAIDALNDDSSTRKQVVMACGTGKTVIAYKYLEQFLGASRILILVPSLSLMRIW